MKWSVWVFGVAMLATNLSFPSQAKASSGSLYCQAVTAAIGAAAGWGLVGGIGGVIDRMATAAGAIVGSSGFSGRCQQRLEDFANHYQRNPIDYDEFVRATCGGNPLNCPGNLDPYRPWDRFPSDCSTFVTCALPAIRDPFTSGPFTSISVQDLLDAATFVGISGSYGHWAISDFGYLVNADSSGHYIP